MKGVNGMPYRGKSGRNTQREIGRQRELLVVISVGSRTRMWKELLATRVLEKSGKQNVKRRTKHFSDGADTPDDVQFVVFHFDK